MSFHVNSCLGCSLDFGTKFIGFFCAIIAALMSILYGTPALLGKIPETRMIFYSAVTSFCGVHVLLSCLLIYSAFKGIKDLNMFDEKKNHLFTIDDLMGESDERVADIFTKGSHHKNLSEIPHLMRLWSVYTWCISVLLITLALTGIVMKYVGVRASIYAYRSNGSEEIIASIYFVVGVLLFYFATVVESQRQKIILLRYRPNDSGVTLLVYT